MRCSAALARQWSATCYLGECAVVRVAHISSRPQQRAASPGSSRADCVGAIRCAEAGSAGLQSERPSTKEMVGGACAADMRSPDASERPARRDRLHSKGAIQYSGLHFHLAQERRGGQLGGGWWPLAE